MIKVRHIISFPLKEQGITARLKEKAIFNKAIEKSTRSSGIDFYKLIIGDSKERRRYNLKNQQSTLYNDELPEQEGG
ncbi:hypothetical protein YDYSY3_39110 [Paenibacillus chitinolyticus]|uniref:hypothetical protein n=1 Tax=Paenibacillus chitinolyticus TaxID=79263 RepID=UPI0026E4A9C8|nr:hypothetical protein [Paenibacillus chitinolyticus]GKS12911.1 hypothetical protein YDYSY3_39110 [Paenibacillus chitinolyticus]